MVPLCGVCNNVGLTEMVVVDVVVHIVYSFYVVIYPDGPPFFSFFLLQVFPQTRLTGDTRIQIFQMKNNAAEPEIGIYVPLKNSLD